MRNACCPQYHSFQLREFGNILGTEPSDVMQMVDEHRDDPEQFLVEVIHHWLQKHPKPHWWELEFAMFEILGDFPSHHRPHFAVRSALKTLMKEYEG